MGDVRRRVIEVTDVRPLIVKEGPIYETTNQEGFLGTFERIYPSDPSTLTVVYFAFAENPIALEVEVQDFIRVMAGEIQDITANQICGHGRGRAFTLSSILPESGKEIRGVVMAHLLMHILLFFAIRCLEPIDFDEPEDFSYEERVRENLYNPEHEALGVFNFPTRTAHVHIIADFIADYLHRWSKGEVTTDFQEFLKAQARTNDLSRKRTHL